MDKWERNTYGGFTLVRLPGLVWPQRRISPSPVPYNRVKGFQQPQICFLLALHNKQVLPLVPKEQSKLYRIIVLVKRVKGKCSSKTDFFLSRVHRNFSSGVFSFTQVILLPRRFYLILRFNIKIVEISPHASVATRSFLLLGIQAETVETQQNFVVYISSKKTFFLFFKYLAHPMDNFSDS